MTKAELDEITKRAEIARPGPWTIAPAEYRPTHAGGIIAGNGACVGMFEVGAEPFWPDAAFIAHARTDIPRLVEWARKARGALEAYTRHDVTDRCLACHANNHDPHAADCQVAALLK